MDNYSFHVDMTDAQAKVSRLLNMDWLFRRKLGVWKTTTVEHIKRRATGDLIGTRTGHLKRNIGAKLAEIEGGPGVVMGTGEQVGLKAVIYAKIQEEGGTIRSKGKKLTIPFPGVLGLIRNYPGGKFIKVRGKTYYVRETLKRSRSGNWSRDLQFLFSLRDQVNIPPTHFFSIPIRDRLALLDEIFVSQEFADELMSAGADTGGSYD